MPPSYRVEALSKGLRLLTLFDEGRLSLRLKEIAELTGYPMPTVFRLTSTLVDDGFLERRPDGSYAPGVAVLTLGSAAVRGSGLVRLCEAPLAELAELTGETVNLGVLVADRVLYLVRLRNDDLVTANIQVGSTLPAAHTSMGKVLLAALPPDELDRRLTPTALAGGAGPHAAADLADLRERVARVREQGYAVQDQELAQGLRSVAAAVVDRTGTTVAAVNIAVSTSRHTVDDLHGPLLDRLRSTTALIGRKVATS